MELRLRAMGLSLGLIWGLAVLLGTWWFLIQGQPGEYVTKLRTVYIGYDVSWGGSLIGFLWGFVDGFIVGVLLAWFYNKFSKILYRKKQ